MDSLSLRAVKQATAASASPVAAAVHAQAESVLIKPTKTGGEFLEIRLVDAHDSCSLRIWSDAAIYPAARAIAQGSFVCVAGEWTSGQYGLDARNFQIRSLTDEERASVLAGPIELREKQARDYASILELVASVVDPRLRAVADQFLHDHGERLKRTGAAREYHHARRGGLVEHVGQMMRTASAVCAAYPTVNRDLVLVGVLFHDCGKLWENCYAEQGFSMPYQEHGELLGHIPMGIELVNKLWRRLMEDSAHAGWSELVPNTEEVRLHLLHLIASHHGEYQFGSPVLPKTPEAIVLHHVDNIDAKLEMMFHSHEVAPMLARNIYERQRPLPMNLVRPLPTFIPPATDA
jgi:3'-5' exoribonuclease